MIVEIEIKSGRKCILNWFLKKIKSSNNALIGEFYTSNCEISKDVKSILYLK